MRATCMRAPHTMNERRANEIIKEEVIISLGMRIRRARLGHNLVSAWDDIYRACPVRSWKSHRKTQYRVVQCSV